MCGKRVQEKKTKIEGKILNEKINSAFENYHRILNAYEIGKSGGKKAPGNMNDKNTFEKLYPCDDIFNVRFGIKIEPVTQSLFCFINAIGGNSKDGGDLIGRKMESG